MESFKRWDINLKNITGLPILVLIKRSGTRERRSLFSGLCFVNGNATFVLLFLFCVCQQQAGQLLACSQGRVLVRPLVRQILSSPSWPFTSFVPSFTFYQLVSTLCLLGSNTTLEQRSSVQSSFLRREWHFPPPPDREFCFLKQHMAFYMSYPFRKYYQRCWSGGAGKREWGGRGRKRESKREERENT